MPHKRVPTDFAEEWRRYEWGLAIVESKRWNLPLDRRFASRATRRLDADASLFASVDDLAEGKLRWGILTMARSGGSIIRGAVLFPSSFLR